MNADQGLFVPLILGILEGLTEFLPVSSTGHLLLAGHFFGLTQPATFIVLIQLGAILAVITVYFAKLGMLIRDALTGKAYAWQFALSVILACLPAVVAGVLLRDFIQGDLWESAALICWTLLIGGVILLIVDRLPLQPKYDDIYQFPWHLALIVGLFQMLSLVPGVSRSGSTVVGGMLFGAIQARGGRIHLLHRPADHGRRLRLRPLQEPRPDRHAPSPSMSPSALPRPSSSAPWWCDTCWASSASMALRRSPGGALRSASPASSRSTPSGR